jgi:hypothetical protein
MGRVRVPLRFRSSSPRRCGCTLGGDRASATAQLFDLALSLREQLCDAFEALTDIVLDDAHDLILR